MPGMTIHEFDILRSPEHDLSLPDSWGNLAKLVVRPNTVFISSPPCATFLDPVTANPAHRPCAPLSSLGDSLG